MHSMLLLWSVFGSDWLFVFLYFHRNELRFPPIKAHWIGRSGISLLSILNMASGGPIKLFQFVRKLCQSVGISLQPNQNRYHMNSMNWFTLFGLIQSIISTIAFILFEAESMAEFGISFFVFLCAFICVFYSLGILLKVKHIPKNIGNWEAFIEKSESNNFLLENRQNIFDFNYIFMWYRNSFYYRV